MKLSLYFSKELHLRYPQISEVFQDGDGKYRAYNITLEALRSSLAPAFTIDPDTGLRLETPSEPRLSLPLIFTMGGFPKAFPNTLPATLLIEDAQRVADYELPEFPDNRFDRSLSWREMRAQRFAAIASSAAAPYVDGSERKQRQISQLFQYEIRKMLSEAAEAGQGARDLSKNITALFVDHIEQLVCRQFGHFGPNGGKDIPYVGSDVEEEIWKATHAQILGVLEDMYKAMVRPNLLKWKSRCVDGQALSDHVAENVGAMSLPELSAVIIASKINGLCAHLDRHLRAVTGESIDLRKTEEWLKDCSVIAGADHGLTLEGRKNAFSLYGKSVPEALAIA